MENNILRFLNDYGQLVVWPKKHANKQLVLVWLAGKFDASKVYNENEVNEILKQWHTFQDWPLLRRSLVDSGFLSRDINGYEYRRVTN